LAEKQLVLGGQRLAYMLTQIFKTKEDSIEQTETTFLQ